MKTGYPYLITVILLLLGVIYFMYDSLERKDNTYQESLRSGETVFQSRLSSDSSKIASLEQDLADTVKSLRKQNESFLNEINRLNSKIIPVDQLPKLPSECDTCLHQLVIRDEKITAQTGLIEGLQKEISVSEAKNADIKESLHTQIERLDSANTAKFRKIDSLLSGPTSSSWSLGITGGVGTTYSQGELHAGPTINFGLTKTIKIKKIRLRDLFRKKR